MVVQRLADGCGKPVAVDRQRPAGGHLIGVGGPHDQRASRRISACSRPTALWRRRPSGRNSSRRARPGLLSGAPRSSGPGASRAGRPNAGIGDLPGRFRTGKAAANHVDGISLGSAGNHARRVSEFSHQAHLPEAFSSEATSGFDPCGDGVELGGRVESPRQ